MSFTNRLRLCAFGVVFVACSWGGRAFGGDLNPPAGPIAPTHKSLTEIEPRIAIGPATTPGDGDSVRRITQSGSYYMTGTISATSGRAGIEVTASGVTIDMNGFEIVGAAGSLSGIRATSLSMLTIRNGTIRNCGGDGIAAGGVTDVSLDGVVLRINSGNGATLSHSARVTNCTASSNGGHGLLMNGGCVVTTCVAFGNAGTGFGVTPQAEGGIAAFSDCVSRSNGDSGFAIHSGVAIANCTAAANAVDGFVVGSSGIIRGCVALENGGVGIHTEFNLPPSPVTGGQMVVSECVARLNGEEGINIRISNSVVSGCSANFNTLSGIRVGGSTTVRGNQSTFNGNNGDGAGILVAATDCRVENNNVSSNDRGIEVSVSGCIITGNTCTGNTTNYDIAANNKVGVIISAPNSAAISGSTGGTGLGTTDPWANFSF